MGKKLKQFSLFTSPEAPVEIIIEPNEAEEIKENVEIKEIPNLNEKESISYKELKQLFFDSFEVKECKRCGSKRLERYNYIILCKKCGTEYNPGGILFGSN